MIDRHARMNKVSSYQVGDHVLVQNPIAKTRRGKRIFVQIPSLEGVILEQKGLEYKVQYVIDEDAQLSDFFLTSQIISKTKKTENSRKKAL